MRRVSIPNYAVPVGTISTLIAMHAIFIAHPRLWLFRLAMSRSLVPAPDMQQLFPVKTNPNAALETTASKHYGPIVNHSKCTSPSSLSKRYDAVVVAVASRAVCRGWGGGEEDQP